MKKRISLEEAQAIWELGLCETVGLEASWYNGDAYSIVLSDGWPMIRKSWWHTNKKTGEKMVPRFRCNVE